jgi:putative FmdB family regulatory protein
MPTYDYVCEPCKQAIELFHAISNKKRPKCPKCGKPMTRLISGGAGIIFKGSGFYETDYKKKEQK